MTTAQPDEDFYRELLDHIVDMIAAHGRSLADVERTRRIYATMASRNGVEKKEIAATLGISRPTLDAWIERVESTPEELGEVEGHELFKRKWNERKAARP